MEPNWEWIVIGFFVAVWVVYTALYEWFLWKETRRWCRQLPKYPIYGPPDLHRTRGSQARPNLRTVSR